MTDFEYFLSDMLSVSEQLVALQKIYAFFLSVASYVLCSLGLYAVAHRRGIHHPWLAWLPVGNLWLLGSISDQYQYLVKGRIRIRRRVLLGLSIATAALCVLCVYSIVVGGMLSEPVDAGISIMALVASISLLAVLAAVIALLVYQYMCYYDLFRSCDQGNGALYLIMCFLFSGVMPFLVFACRKKDEGMPPRRQPTPQPVQAVPEVTQVPVEEEPQIEDPQIHEEETEGEVSNE